MWFDSCAADVHLCQCCHVTVCCQVAGLCSGQLIPQDVFLPSSFFFCLSVPLLQSHPLTCVSFLLLPKCESPVWLQSVTCLASLTLSSLTPLLSVWQHFLFFFTLHETLFLFHLLFLFRFDKKSNEKVRGKVSWHSFLTLNHVAQIPPVERADVPRFSVHLVSRFIVSLVHLVNEVQAQLFRGIKVFLLLNMSLKNKNWRGLKRRNKKKRGREKAGSVWCINGKCCGTFHTVTRGSAQTCRPCGPVIQFCWPSRE